jgi:hypothetical protein
MQAAIAMDKIVYTLLRINMAVQAVAEQEAEDLEDYRAEQYVVVPVYIVDI